MLCSDCITRCKWRRLINLLERKKEGDELEILGAGFDRDYRVEKPDQRPVKPQTPVIDPADTASAQGTAHPRRCFAEGLLRVFGCSSLPSRIIVIFSGTSTRLSLHNLESFETFDGLPAAEIDAELFTRNRGMGRKRNAIRGSEFPARFGFSFYCDTLKIYVLHAS